MCPSRARQRTGSPAARPERGRPHPARRRARLSAAYLVLVAISVLGTLLAAVTNSAAVEAAAATTEIATTKTNSPAVVSGTISYLSSYSVPGGCAGCRTSESLSVTMTVTGKANIAAANNPGTDWDNPDVYHSALSSRAGSTCYWVPLTVEKATLHYRFYTRVAMSQGCATYASATGTYKAASTPLPLGLDLVLNPGHGRDAWSRVRALGAAELRVVGADAGSELRGPGQCEPSNSHDVHKPAPRPPPVVLRCHRTPGTFPRSSPAVTIQAKRN